VGEVVVELGGGRYKKGDEINYGVGIIVHIKVGDKIAIGQPLVSIHANSEAGIHMAEEKILGAISWSDDPVQPLPYFYGKINQGIGETGINQ
jgi:pyrimidine-nucleoside phosphorylase